MAFSGGKHTLFSSVHQVAESESMWRIADREGGWSFQLEEWLDAELKLDVSSLFGDWWVISNVLGVRNWMEGPERN
jgi:hypothetical protein